MKIIIGDLIFLNCLGVMGGMISVEVVNLNSIFTLIIIHLISSQENVEMLKEV